MNLRILPSEFLLAGYGDYDVDLDLDLDVDLVAQAEADFGIESAGGGAPSFDDILSIPDPFEAMESTMAAALDDGEFCFDQLFSGGDSPLDDWYNDVLDGDEDDELDSNSNDGGRKTREPNAFPYRFGDVYEANWYRQYLRHGDVRPTHRSYRRQRHRNPQGLVQGSRMGVQGYPRPNSMRERCLFDLRRRLSSLANIDLPHQRCVIWYSGGLFFGKPREYSKRCRVCLRYSQEKVEDTRVRHSLSQHRSCREGVHCLQYAAQHDAERNGDS